MANPKNKGEDVNTNGANGSNQTQWVDEQIGFAPYWKPEPGKVFIARPVSIDERDPEFVRYQMQCEQVAIECQRGPADGAETVTVNPGEQFSLSVYTQLAGVFNFYMESGIYPVCRVEALKEQKTSKPGQTVWMFKLQVTPADKARLEAARKENTKAQLADRNERAAMSA